MRRLTRLFTAQSEAPLTQERLFGWQASLFPAGFSGLRKIQAGMRRDGSTGPMKVISGPGGRERMHFEAPAAQLMKREMRALLRWFNGRNTMDPVMKAALTHFWFMTIHPFDDGNGRIARAMADMALACSEESDQRFYSMSAQICRTVSLLQHSGADTEGYARHNSLDKMVLRVYGTAIESAQGTLGKVIAKSNFWEAAANVDLNERQRLMLNR